jgi:hypothetical protein
MSAPSSSAASLDFPAIVHAARLELESAGNPSYVVALVDAAGEPHLSPMVFFTNEPAVANADRLLADGRAGEQVFIISRQAVGRRALFTVLDPCTLKKLHTQLEVVETTFAQDDAPV